MYIVIVLMQLIIFSQNNLYIFFLYIFYLHIKTNCSILSHHPSVIIQVDAAHWWWLEILLHAP